eukprot:3002230-Pyramimonas_sp.AAC.1
MKAESLLLCRAGKPPGDQIRGACPNEHETNLLEGKPPGLFSISQDVDLSSEIRSRIQELFVIAKWRKEQAEEHLGKAILEQLLSWAQGPEVEAAIVNVPQAARMSYQELLAVLHELPADPGELRDLLDEPREVLAKVSPTAMWGNQGGFQKFL